MKRRDNTPKKLTEELQAKLEAFKDDAINNNVRISEDQFNNLVEVYHFITNRVLSKGCSTCIPEAFKIIRNYLAIFPDPKPKILSSNTKKLKPKEDKKSESIAKAVTKANKEEKPFVFPTDLDDKEKLAKSITKEKEINVDLSIKTGEEKDVSPIKVETKKKAPAKKKAEKKSNAKASPRERRKRK